MAEMTAPPALSGLRVEETAERLLGHLEAMGRKPSTLRAYRSKLRGADQAADGRQARRPRAARRRRGVSRRVPEGRAVGQVHDQLPSACFTASSSSPSGTAGPHRIPAGTSTLREPLRSRRRSISLTAPRSRRYCEPSLTTRTGRVQRVALSRGRDDRDAPRRTAGASLAGRGLERTARPREPQLRQRQVRHAEVSSRTQRPASGSARRRARPALSGVRISG